MAFGEEGSLSRWKELRGAKNPAWFKSPQPCAPRSVHFGVCRVVGGESAEILAYGLCYDPVWVPGRWESRSGGGGGAFPAQGTPLPPSAGPLLPKFGARSGMRCAPGWGPGGGAGMRAPHLPRPSLLLPAGGSDSPEASVQRGQHPPQAGAALLTAPTLRPR